jgi:hypothetical protein
MKRATATRRLLAALTLTLLGAGLPACGSSKAPAVHADASAQDGPSDRTSTETGGGGGGGGGAGGNDGAAADTATGN